jgi:hypothetical protein
MSGIDEMVAQQLKGPALQQISQQLGLDPASTQQAVTAALPIVLAGMATHASNPDGAADIHSIADRHAVPADMSTPASLFGGGGGGLLAKIFGARERTVQDGVSNASGLDIGKAASLVAMIAPYVLSAIAHKKQNADLQPGDLAGTLQQAQQTAQTTAQRQHPSLGGILGSVMNQVMDR